MCPLVIVVLSFVAASAALCSLDGGSVVVDSLFIRALIVCTFCVLVLLPFLVLQSSRWGL